MHFPNTFFKKRCIPLLEKAKLKKAVLFVLFFLFVYCANFAVLTSLKFEKEKDSFFPDSCRFSSK